MSDPRNIALKLIDQLLAATGLSMSGLARKANVSPSTVTKHYELGETTTPSTVTLVKLADAANHRLVMLPMQNNAERPALPDLDLLRLAMILALQIVPEDEPDRAFELGRIAAMAYGELAGRVAEMGYPFPDDAAALSHGATWARGYKDAQRQPSRGG